METLAVQETGAAAGTIGTVVAIAEDRCRVRTDDERGIEARRAVSCLVAPEEGDRVLVFEPGSASPYVLAVLERPEGGPVRLTAEGDLAVEVGSGGFAVRAAGGLELVSEGELTLGADGLRVHVREARLSTGAVTLLAGRVESVLESLSLSVRRAFRRVEEIDHLRAGAIDYAAEGLTRVHGEHTVLTARQLLKSDAPQIHVG